MDNLSDLANFGLLAAAIGGAVVTLKTTFPEKVHGAMTAIVAIGLGALAGWQHVQGVPDVATGVMAGLAILTTFALTDRATGRDLKKEGLDLLSREVSLKEREMALSKKATNHTPVDQAAYSNGLQAD